MKIYKSDRLIATMLVSAIAVSGAVGQVAWGDQNKATGVSSQHAHMDKSQVTWKIVTGSGDTVAGAKFKLSGGVLKAPIEIVDNGEFDHDDAVGAVSLDTSMLTQDSGRELETGLVANKYELTLNEEQLPEEIAVTEETLKPRSFEINDDAASVQLDDFIVEDKEKKIAEDSNTESAEPYATEVKEPVSKSRRKRAAVRDSNPSGVHLSWEVKDQKGDPVPGVTVIVQGPYNDRYGYGTWNEKSGDFSVTDQDNNDKNRKNGSVAITDVHGNAIQPDGRYRVRIDALNLPHGYSLGNNNQGWREIPVNIAAIPNVGKWNGKNSYDFGAFELHKDFLVASPNSACKPETVLGINNQGDVFRVELKDRGRELNLGTFGRGELEKFKKKHSGSTWNSIAVDKKSGYVYATLRMGDFEATTKPYRVARMKIGEDGTLGEPQWAGGVDEGRIWAENYIDKRSPRIKRWGYVVAGEADSTTGDYYIGASYWHKEGNNAKLYFAIDRYNVAYKRLEHIGVVKTEHKFTDKGFGATWNGDFAFNSRGDLIVFGGIRNHVSVFGIKHENLKVRGSIDSIPYFESNAVDVPDKGRMKDADGINGVTFSSDGRVAFSNSSLLFTADPARLSTTTDLLRRITYNSVDLSSCATPFTVLLKKNIVGRPSSREADEFKLSIVDTATSSSLGEVETQGGATGVQNKLVGPVALVAPSTLTFREKIADGSDISSYYSSEYVCTDQTGRELTKGKGPEFNLQVNGRGGAVECTFTNHPIKTELRLKKIVIAESGNPITKPKDYQLMAVGHNDRKSIEYFSDENKSVAPGLYHFSEHQRQQAMPIDYELKDLFCIDRVTGIKTDISNRNQEYQIKPGDKVDCIFVNQEKALNGLVKWRKHDSRGHVLAGSEWSITGPDSRSRTITDCAKQPCKSGGDVNPKPGELEVRNLTLGKYELKEIKPPVGYMVNDTDESRGFEITIDKREIDLTSKPFVNKRVPVPPIPLTGGTSTDLFLVVGSGLLFLSLLALGIQRRFKRM